MSVETEVGAAETTDDADPDVGFQCGLGLWVGTVLAGAVSVALAATGAGAVSVLGSYPTALTGGLIAGILLSRTAGGLVERIGARRRRRWLYGLAPAAATGAIGALAWLADLPGVAAAAVLAAAPITLAGLVVAAMARNRYVDRVTGEPAAAWTWKRTGLFRPEHVFGVPVVGIGLFQIYAGSWARGVLWLCLGATLIAVSVAQVRSLEDGGWLDEWESDAASRLEIHDAGLVASEGLTTSLIPWSAIEDVSLTDDELAIDRGWRSIRCDRRIIDDPEGVYEALRDRLP